MKKLVTFAALAAILGTLGCASGGGQQAAAGGERAAGTTTDAAGFVREMGPAEIAYQSGQQFLAAGNFDEAIAHFRSAVAQKPTYLEAWTDLGSTLTKVKDYQGSTAAYEKALAIKPDNDPVIQAIAYNYLYLENWSKAQEYYEKLVAKDSLSYDGNVHLGFIFQKKMDQERAIQYYERALQAQPNDATTLGTLAGLYEKKGNEDKKIEYLQRAIAAAPDQYKFKTQLGSTYIKRKDWANALPIFDDLTKTYPDQAAYWQNMGLVLSQIPDRKKEAPAALEKALTLKGDDAYIAGILAQVYNDLGDHQKAIATVKRGIDSKTGQEPFLYYQWGVALSKLEQFDDATAMFQKVLALNDPQWNEAAKKQIDRQAQLKKRAEMKKAQEQ